MHYCLFALQILQVFGVVYLYQKLTKKEKRREKDKSDLDKFKKDLLLALASNNMHTKQLSLHICELQVVMENNETRHNSHTEIHEKIQAEIEKIREYAKKMLTLTQESFEDI